MSPLGVSGKLKGCAEGPSKILSSKGGCYEQAGATLQLSRLSGLKL